MIACASEMVNFFNEPLSPPGHYSAMRNRQEAEVSVGGSREVNSEVIYESGGQISTPNSLLPASSPTLLDDSGILAFKSESNMDNLHSSKVQLGGITSPWTLYRSRS